MPSSLRFLVFVVLAASAQTTAIHNPRHQRPHLLRRPDHTHAGYFDRGSRIAP